MAVGFRLLSCQRLTYKVFFELHFDFDFPHKLVKALACVDTACTARHLSMT